MPRRTWGPDGPPPEAYSRVTDADRFRPVIPAALAALDRLEAAYLVTRIEGRGIDPELERFGSPARDSVRLEPERAEEAPVTIAFSTFPGVHLRLGKWVMRSFPVCGCDACDEDAADAIGDLHWHLECAVSGGLTERVDVPLIGDAWQRAELSRERARRSGGSKIPRARAKALIAEVGASAFAWAPWSKR